MSGYDISEEELQRYNLLPSAMLQAKVMEHFINVTGNLTESLDYAEQQAALAFEGYLDDQESVERDCYACATQRYECEHDK
jgi:hypothetical protein